jgi:hypothetical protein
MSIAQRRFDAPLRVTTVRLRKRLDVCSDRDPYDRRTPREGRPTTAAPGRWQFRRWRVSMRRPGLMTMRQSWIAFPILLALGFISMGGLGAILYVAVSPLLAPVFGSLGSGSGDWVWPATILAGMAWSPSVLVAGHLDRYWARRGVGVVRRRISYGAIVYAGAALVWGAVLVMQDTRA